MLCFNNILNLTTDNSDLFIANEHDAIQRFDGGGTWKIEVRHEQRKDIVFQVPGQSGGNVHALVDCKLFWGIATNILEQLRTQNGRCGLVR